MAHPREGPDPAHRVSAGSFDADDVGAQVGQQLGAIDADRTRKVKHLEVGQRSIVPVSGT